MAFILFFIPSRSVQERRRLYKEQIYLGTQLIISRVPTYPALCMGNFSMHHPHIKKKKNLYLANEAKHIGTAVRKRPSFFKGGILS